MDILSLLLGLCLGICITTVVFLIVVVKELFHIAFEDDDN